MSNESRANNETNALLNLFQVAADIIGEISGVGIGMSINGVPGAVLGGAVAPVVSTMLQKTAGEVIQRQLSQRQKARIGTTLYFTEQTIRRNIQNGKEIRTDDFFQAPSGDRAASEEIAEAIILAAQQEYAEKKLQLYGRLLANIAFHEEVDRGLAQQLTNHVQQLTYRQLCFVSLLLTHRARLGATVRGARSTKDDPLAQEAIKLEIYDLFHKGIIKSGTASGFQFIPCQLMKAD